MNYLDGLISQMISSTADLSFDQSVQNQSETQINIQQEQEQSQILERIMNLSDDKKFLVWLYVPYDILPLKKIRRLQQKYQVPDNLILRKIILNKLHLRGESPEQVVQYLLDQKLLTVYHVSQLKKLVEQCQKDYSFKCMLNSANMDKIFQVGSKLQEKKEKDIKEAPHPGYPLPDPVKGRPHVGWCECYHQKCHRVFPNALQLLAHLEKLDKHTHSFHKFHEQAVEWPHCLTPEKIHEKKMTRCPALICDKKYHEFTPEELCEHFTLLGIPPFWQPGMKITNPAFALDATKDKPEVEPLGPDSYQDIYITDFCLVCYENPPEVVLLPCYHHIFCLECYFKHQQQPIGTRTKCPMCRKDIKAVIPF